MDLPRKVNVKRRPLVTGPDRVPGPKQKVHADRFAFANWNRLACGTRQGKVDVAVIAVPHGHRNRLRVRIAVLVGSDNGDFVVVVLVLVRRRLEVLPGQRQFSGPGVDGEFRRIVALKRPADVADRRARNRGNARSPCLVLRHGGVRKSRDGHVGIVVVADGDYASPADIDVGVAHPDNGHLKTLVLFADAVLRGLHRHSGAGVAGGNDEDTAGDAGEIRGRFGAARDGLPGYGGVRAQRTGQLHRDGRLVPLVDQGVGKRDPVGVVVADGGGGDAAAAVEGKVAGKAGQRHGECLVGFVVVVFGCSDGEAGERRFGRGGPGQRDPRARLGRVVVARLGGPVAGGEKDVGAGGLQGADVVHIDLELRRLPFPGRVDALHAKPPDVVVHDGEQLPGRVQMRSVPFGVDVGGGHAKCLFAFPAVVLGRIDRQNGLGSVSGEANPQRLAVSATAYAPGIPLVPEQAHVVLGTGGKRCVPGARAARFQAGENRVRCPGSAAAQPNINAASFGNLPAGSADPVARAVVVGDRGFGACPGDCCVARVGQRHGERLVGLGDRVFPGGDRESGACRSGRDRQLFGLASVVVRRPGRAVGRCRSDGNGGAVRVAQADGECGRSALGDAYVADRQFRRIVVGDRRGGVGGHGRPCGEVEELQAESLRGLVEVVADDVESDGGGGASGRDGDHAAPPAGVVLSEGGGVSSRRAGHPAQSDGLSGDLVELDGECQLLRRIPRVPLGHGHVRDGDAGTRVVVADAADCLAPPKIGGARLVVAENGRNKHFFRLIEGVLQKPYTDRPAGFARLDGRSAGAHDGFVVFPGSGASGLAWQVPQYVEHLHVACYGGAQGEGKHEGLPFGLFRSIGDRQGGAVVDGGGGCRGVESHIAPAGRQDQLVDADSKSLRALVGGVVERLHLERHTGLALPDGGGCLRHGGVVAAGVGGGAGSGTVQRAPLEADFPVVGAHSGAVGQIHVEHGLAAFLHDDGVGVSPFPESDAMRGGVAVVVLDRAGGEQVAGAAGKRCVPRLAEPQHDGLVFFHIFVVRNRHRDGLAGLPRREGQRARGRRRVVFARLRRAAPRVGVVQGHAARTRAVESDPETEFAAVFAGRGRGYRDDWFRIVVGDHGAGVDDVRAARQDHVRGLIHPHADDFVVLVDLVPDQLNAQGLARLPGPEGNRLRAHRREIAAWRRGAPAGAARCDAGHPHGHRFALPRRPRELENEEVRRPVAFRGGAHAARTECPGRAGGVVANLNRFAGILLVDSDPVVFAFEDFDGYAAALVSPNDLGGHRVLYARDGGGGAAHGDGVDALVGRIKKIDVGVVGNPHANRETVVGRNIGREDCEGDGVAFSDARGDPFSGD